MLYRSYRGMTVSENDISSMIIDGHEIFDQLAIFATIYEGTNNAASLLSIWDWQQHNGAVRIFIWTANVAVHCYPIGAVVQCNRWPIDQ